MTMPMFKIGDRVRMVRRDRQVPYGTIGIVLEDKAIPFVDWEGFDDGHDWSFNDFRKSVLLAHEDWLELVAHESIHDAEEDGGGAVFGALHAMGVI